MTVEGNVIACCYIDPLLIDECDFKSTDFITSDGTFYYSLAKQLRKQGYTVFDEVTILSSVSENIAEAFQERGGFETIKNMTDVVNVKNAEIYLDNLYRENIILGMCNDGFNLLTPVDWNGKEVIPLKLFRKMDSESVLDWYESKLSAYGTGFTSRVLEEDYIDFDDEYFESMDSGEDTGIPFDIAGDDINHIKTNGGRCFTIVGRGKNIKSANEKVYRYIDSIKIDGSWYRKDIGYKFFLSENKED